MVKTNKLKKIINKNKIKKIKKAYTHSPAACAVCVIASIVLTAAFPENK